MHTRELGRRLSRRSGCAPRERVRATQSPFCGTAWQTSALCDPDRGTPARTTAMRARRPTSTCAGSPRASRSRRCWSRLRRGAAPARAAARRLACESDPLLGVPAPDRGRARAPRAQALGEPRVPGRRRARAHARPRGVAARGDRRGRPAAPRAGAAPSRRARRVHRLGRAHEHRHARRGRRARRPLRLRHRARARLARRRGRRPPREALPRAPRDHDPCDRVRPPPGLGGQASRRATSTGSSAGWRTAPSR